MIKRITIVAMLLCLFSRCSHVLDVSPENSLTFRNALETERDIETTLSGTGQLVLEMVAADHYSQPLKGEYADDENVNDILYLWRTLSPQGSRDGSWTSNYRLIAQANIVLQYIESISASNERKEFYKGQAYFYKALAYFELIRQYGDCVLVRDEVNVEPQGKTAWTEVADYAVELAQHAVDLLPEFDQVRDSRGNSPQYKSTPCKGAANALLAHLCAWKAGGKYFAIDASYEEQALWTRAEAATTSIIESGTYSLASDPEEVVSSVLVGDSEESIYETVFKGLWYERPPGFSLLPIFDIYQGWPLEPFTSPASVRFKPLRIYNSTVTEFYPHDDERKYAYFYNFDEMAHPDNLPITGGFAFPYKWRIPVIGTEGWEAGTLLNYDNNTIWWRLADIILLRAECRARLGNDAGAIADINIVRARANSPLYNASEYGGDVRYAVFKEREKELLMEWHRYYDIIRNGYARAELKGRFLTASDQDFKDGAFFLTIPQNEFANNPLMRQNIYWSRYM